MIERIKWKLKSVSTSSDDLLADIIELYDQSEDDIDEIIKWINYYKQDPEKLKSDIRSSIRNKYRVTSVNSSVNESTDLVKEIYRPYRKERPLLTGEETLTGMESVVGTSEDWNRFQRVSDEHIDFLRKAKQKISECKEVAQTQKYDLKAYEQRDKSIDDDIGDISPLEIKKEMESIRSDKLTEEDNTIEEQKEEEDDQNLMYRYQVAFYLVKYLRREKDNEVYQKLKSGHPSQAQTIERKIHSVGDLDKCERLDELPPLSKHDIQYIKKYVNDKKEIVETPQEFRDKTNHEW